MQLKVCGLTAAQDLEACVDARVDAVGFVLVRSPRQIDPLRARDLGRRLPPEIARVAVFRQVDAGAISMALEAHATLIQGHFLPGMISAARAAGLAVLPALVDGGDLAQAQALWDLGVPQVLIDGPDPGSGRASRWDHIAQIARVGGVVLAGGLTPENVAEMEKCHIKMIFDSFNEALDSMRPFKLKGKPLPWKVNA